MTYAATVRRLILKHRNHAISREQSLLMRANGAIGMTEQDRMNYHNRIQGELPSTFMTDYDLSSAAMS
ncbi:MAG: hypothetical protein AB4040_15700 [Synechococcus sp.]